MQKAIFTKEYGILVGMLIELRQNRNLTQVQLSILLNRPQSYISKYENLERRLDICEVREICLVLNKSFPLFIQEFEDNINATKR